MEHKLILLVEDNDAEATLMDVAVRKSGVTAAVTRARDGEEALGILFCAHGNGDA